MESWKVFGVFSDGVLLYAWHYSRCSALAAELMTALISRHYESAGTEYFAWDYA